MTIPKVGSAIKLISIKPSPKATKKYDAVFNIDYGKTNKTKTVSFGAKGYSDFTMHKNEVRKQAYLTRHRTTEDWTNPITPGALSRYVLWNKTSLTASIADFKRRFNL
jgi:hypothetical protein